MGTTQALLLMALLVVGAARIWQIINEE